MSRQHYTQLGGILPETATLTNVLANQGFVSPHNGRPLSGAMVLGIAGGLGCGYILWEFEKYESAILVMGFHNKWNYPTEFMQKFCDRVGVTAEFLETGGTNTAANHLNEALVFTAWSRMDAPDAWEMERNRRIKAIQGKGNRFVEDYAVLFGKAAPTAPVPAAPDLVTPPATVPTAHPSGWTCGTKTTCGQMASCEEAKFHLTQCGVKSLDRDGDGVPCAALCR